MFDVFKGWRRKVGCGLLVVALLCFVAWVRGQFFGDLFDVPGSTSTLQVCSGYWGLGVHYSTYEGTPQTIRWQTFPTPTPEMIKEGEEYNASHLDPDDYWRWECCGLQMSKVAKERYVAISYWYFIGPLTVVAAYLILWSSRKNSEQGTTLN